MMLSLLPTAVWAVNDEGSTSSGDGWPAGATGITVATEQYSAKDYEEDTTNVTHSDTIWYKIDGDTLTIGGKGAISDYSNTSELTKVLRFTQADWYKKKDTIKKVVIEDGITGIGTLAITNMTHLESIEIKGTNVELARGAVNNYQGNHNSNPTLTMIVPLSVYQQNQMEKGKWFEAASDSREDEAPNPEIYFNISDMKTIEAKYADVLKLNANDSANWSAIAAAYEEYEALPDVVKAQLNDSVGESLAKLNDKVSESRGWPKGAKGINIALDGFNGSNMDKIGTSDTFWYLLDGSTLKLGGDGAFPLTGYDSSSAKDGNLGFSHASWYGDRDSITSVDVAEGITKLDYLNLTNLYNCDDIYLRNKEIELVNGAVCGYAGDANGKLTLHLENGDSPVAGVSIRLYQAGSESTLQTVTTGEDGTVYAATQKTGSVAAHVTAISAQGVKRWEHAADGDINGVPAVDDQGFVYYNDRTTGKLVKLRPEDGSRVAEIKLADELRSSPTISYDGTIYVNGMKDDKPTVFAVKGAAEGCAASWSQQGGNPSKTEYMY